MQTRGIYQAERSDSLALVSPTEAAISLRGVTKRYGRHTALHALDLEIAEGEFFCLLGPSGCGKTTTLNLIGGFVAPSSGTVHIRGRRVDRLPPYRREVNTVFQSYALFAHMTVRANVGFGLKMARVERAETKARVDEALELVGLHELGQRLPSELSGGQQQRVAVARALVNRPAVLLLDEPLGALDLKLRKRLQVELAQIHREVRTVFVYVTHDQEEAMGLSDRIAVMNRGRIEQIGTPQEIYLRPRSRFVADFIGESNFLSVASLDRRLPLGAGERDPGAVLMVRPEALRISAAHGPGHGLPGEVIHTSFLGNYTRVAVRCDASPEPVIAELHGGGRGTAEALEPGASVLLSWDQEDAVLLTGEQSREDQNSEREGAEDD